MGDLVGVGMVVAGMAVLDVAAGMVAVWIAVDTAVGTITDTIVGNAVDTMADAGMVAVMRALHIALWFLSQTIFSSIYVSQYSLTSLPRTGQELCITFTLRVRSSD
jgi:hypothetical protein